MSALSRRQVFLSGAACTVLTALAVPGHAAMTNKDAELIIVCREAEALAIVYHATFDTEEFEEAQRITNPMTDRIGEMEDEIVEPRATTLEGLAARARALVAYDPAFGDPDYKFHGWEESVSASIIRDLLAMTGGAA